VDRSKSWLRFGGGEQQILDCGKSGKAPWGGDYLSHRQVPNEKNEKGDRENLKGRLC